MRALFWACLAMALSSAELAQAADAPGGKGLLRPLLVGCLSAPTSQSSATLALSVDAIPYSNARIRRELARHNVSTVVDDQTRPSEAQRTEETVTAFLGWDLPGPGAGSIEYDESSTRITRVELSGGQQLAPWRYSRSRRCKIDAHVVDARQALETYEALQPFWLGILVSADRKWISFFSFDPDQFDIELHFNLSKPIAGLRSASSQGMARLLLTDGDARYEQIPARA